VAALGRRQLRIVATVAFIGYSLKMSQHVPHDDSDFASPEEAEAYDRWFRARIEASLADPRPGIPHDQVMAEMDAIIAEAEQRRRSGKATAMSTPLDPLVSEFATAEEAEAYDRWFRAEVEASLADPRPSIPHDQVVAEMDAFIAETKRRRLGGKAK
jgi:hypothetical protein